MIKQKRKRILALICGLAILLKGTGNIGWLVSNAEDSEEAASTAIVEQITGEIRQAVQDGTMLDSADNTAREELSRRIESLGEKVGGLTPEEQSSLADMPEQLENVQAAVLDSYATAQAAEAGTLDGLEESGLENSWRYQNGAPVDNGQEKTDDDSITFYNANGQAHLGIDVSRHQNTIDWNAVRNAGVQFALIRCGYGQDMSSQDDSQWLNNVSACERLGIPYGVYLYSYATSPEMAAGEARHVLRLLNGHSPSLPVFYDLEENRIAVTGTANIGEVAQTFCDAVQNAGYRVGIYGSLYWWNNYFTATNFDNSNWYRWIAQWNSSCNFAGRYEAWQYTSSGSINGISGRVDMDYWYGDYPGGLLPTPQPPAEEEPAMDNGWQAYDEITGNWYWYDADGTMATNKDVYIPSQKKWVRYDENGCMIKGEDYRNNAWYYFDEATGKMQKGFAYLRDNDKWVHYDEVTGKMDYGEVCVKGDWYLFDAVTGAMYKGFTYLPETDKWVYYDKITGIMAHGETTIDENQYYFDEITGKMAHGWCTLPNGRRYYYDLVTGIAA